MKFTALPVNVGDSFLLYVNDKYILVDGGMNKSHIIALLNKERIPNKHIHYLICTHYDADHINGIIGILKSGKYTFDELWLPEIFGSIGYSISEKLEDILVYQRKNYPEIERLSTKEVTEVQIDNDNKERTNSFERINTKVLDELIKFPLDKRLIYTWPYFIIDYDIFPTSINLSMVNALYKISSLLTSALSSGSYIRWFKYTGRYEHYQCPHNLYAENAQETAITIYSPQIFMEMLFLTTINKYSLVFIFDDDDNHLPNVLFTADSDLHFYSQLKRLEEFSIVTAPHHGSEANSLAYSKVYVNNLIFVRSDRSQLRRPGPTFLSQQNRYCTICRTKGPKQKIIIDFTSSRTPQIIGRRCCCKKL